MNTIHIKNTTCTTTGTRRVSVLVGDDIIGWASASRGSREWHLYFMGQDAVEHIAITTKRDAIDWLTDRATLRGGTITK